MIAGVALEPRWSFCVMACVEQHRVDPVVLLLFMAEPLAEPPAHLAWFGQLLLWVHTCGCNGLLGLWAHCAVLTSRHYKTWLKPCPDGLFCGVMPLVWPARALT